LDKLNRKPEGTAVRRFSGKKKKHVGNVSKLKMSSSQRKGGAGTAQQYKGTKASTKGIRLGTVWEAK